MAFAPAASQNKYYYGFLGRWRALEFLLRPEEISAEEIYRRIMVNKVVLFSQLMPKAEALTRKIMAHPANPIKLVKKDVTSVHDPPLKGGLDIKRWNHNILLQSETCQTFCRKFMARKEAGDK